MEVRLPRGRAMTQTDIIVATDFAKGTTVAAGHGPVFGTAKTLLGIVPSCVTAPGLKSQLCSQVQLPHWFPPLSWETQIEFLGQS